MSSGIAYLRDNTDEIGPTMEMLSNLNLRKYSPEELEDLTDNFSEANLFGETQFGKVYRGITQQGQDLTVKIWEDVGHFPVGRNEHRSQLTKECIFLTEPSVNHHPNLVKLLGYCCEDSLLGVVYDLKPLDTVCNLIVKDDFSWLHRIKVAIDLARLLEFLHGQEPQYLVRNIGPPHIMLDQDYNPILFDFGIITGGVFGTNQRIPNKCTIGLEGYLDPTLSYAGMWVCKHDSFSFGAVLLELISKRVYEGVEHEPLNPVFCWANAEYDKKKKKKKLKLKLKKPFFSFGPLKFSFVHSSLEKDLHFSRNDGYKISEVGMRCVRGWSLTERLTMPEVVQSLESLDAVTSLNDVKIKFTCHYFIRTMNTGSAIACLKDNTELQVYEGWNTTSSHLVVCFWSSYPKESMRGRKMNSRFCIQLGHGQIPTEEAKEIVLWLWPLKKFSLVQKSFEEDLAFSRHDGYKITELAMRCVEGFGLHVRPTMKEVIKRFGEFTCCLWSW